MDSFVSSRAQCLYGELIVPGDKSISHRFVMFSSLAEGMSVADNILLGEDCQCTMNAFRAMGVKIVDDGTQCRVYGVGKSGLKRPDAPLYLGNSGTTMRLLSGLLAGQAFDVTLTGDASLSQRPMDRVVHPLKTMGARISGVGDRVCPPLCIQGTSLRGMVHHESRGSAQVKSAVLLAGLYADGVTTVVEEKASRDHTERMFLLYNADFSRVGNQLRITGDTLLKAPADVVVIPGDISSAAFFIIAALIVPDSQITLRNVSLNPTRVGLLHVLKDMGANIEICATSDHGEPIGDITVRSSSLRAVTVTKEQLPFFIDEVPILMIACALAHGRSRIEDASELRVKETDRIVSMTDGIRALGGKVFIDGDTIEIKGIETFKGGCTVRSHHDHRTAMAFIIAGLVSQEPVRVDSCECIKTSYPTFFNDLRKVVN